VNPEQLRDLGFQLEGRAPGGESGGAWFAIAADGARVVLKWFADEGVADRYAVLLPAIDVLRSRGVPVPEYPFVRAVDGWTLSAQQVLPGRSFPIAPPRLVDRMIECVGAAAGIVGGPQPVPALQGWGEFVIHTLDGRRGLGAARLAPSALRSRPSHLGLRRVGRRRRRAVMVPDGRARPLRPAHRQRTRPR
jgi:hypothetical protein